MGVTRGASCHANVTTALMEVVAVRHHIAKARAAFGEAKSAPDEWHRNTAVRCAFAEVDAAERRLVALLQTERGIAMECRHLMVEADGVAGDVRAWAATLRTEPAKVIDFPVRQRPATKRSRRQSENRPRVNENLRIVTDDTPAAC